jgi:hypothetical protein
MTPTYAQDLIPTGCTVENYKTVSAVHAPDGEVIAIVCGPAAPHRARLIAAIPCILTSAGDALEDGRLAPLAYGLDKLNAAVFPSTSLPA